MAKSTLKTILTTGVLMGILGCNPEEQSFQGITDGRGFPVFPASTNTIIKEVKEPKVYEILNGEIAFVPDWNESWAGVSIEYCGMIGDHTFSIAERFGSGHLNLYFPTSAEEIRYGKRRFQVHHVDSERIRLSRLLDD